MTLQNENQIIKLGLIGKSQEARTFVARHLVVSRHFKEIALSDSVLRLMRASYPEKYKYFPWETRLKIYDALYGIDPNIWTNRLAIRIKNWTSRDIVTDDIRYVPEVDQLRELGYIIIRVGIPRVSANHLFKNTFSAQPGLISVHEWYSKTPIIADYSIMVDLKTPVLARKSVDQLISSIKTSKT